MAREQLRDWLGQQLLGWRDAVFLPDVVPRPEVRLAGEAGSVSAANAMPGKASRSRGRRAREISGGSSRL